MEKQTIKFKFKQTPELMQKRLLDLGYNTTRVTNIILRWGYVIGHDVTVKDLIDSWDVLLSGEIVMPDGFTRGISNLGIGTAKSIRAGFFAYLVNDDPGDSLQFVKGDES